MVPRTRSVLKRHAHMLFDWRRTTPLLASVAKTVQAGDVVVDLGCGVGVLSLAAAKAGARRVYAIDVDGEALEFARRQAAQLGLAKKIVFFEDHSFNIDLAEKADLLIQETVGKLAFDENFLPTLCDARKRFLKKGGRIIPEEVFLCGTPVNRRREWLAQAKPLAHVNTKKAARARLTLRRHWKLEKPSAVAGLLVWPKIIWAPDLVTDASPLHPKTHWGQTLLPLASRAAGKKRAFEATLQFFPHPGDPLHYSEVVYHFRRF